MKHARIVQQKKMNNKSGCNHFIRFWLPVYVYAVMIFIGSSISSPAVPIKIPYIDTLLHFVEYVILGYLIARAAKNSSNLTLQVHFRIFACVAAFVYGISDEVHQHFVPGREVEILDLMADGLGGFVGQMLLRR